MIVHPFSGVGSVYYGMKVEEAISKLNVLNVRLLQRMDDFETEHVLFDVGPDRKEVWRLALIERKEQGVQAVSFHDGMTLHLPSHEQVNLLDCTRSQMRSLLGSSFEEPDNQTDIFTEIGVSPYYEIGEANEKPAAILVMSKSYLDELLQTW